MSWLSSYAVSTVSSPTSSASGSTSTAPLPVAPTKTRAGVATSPAVNSSGSSPTSSTSSEASSGSSTSSAPTPIIIGASVGALVLVAAVIGTVVLRRKRRRDDHHFSSDRPDDASPMLERKPPSAFNLAKRVLSTPAVGGQTPRRFDMLEDEESVWSRGSRTPSQRSSRRIPSASSGRSVASVIGGLMTGTTSYGNKRRRISEDGDRTPRLYTDRDLVDDYLSEKGDQREQRQQQKQRSSFFSPTTSLYGSSFSPLGTSVGGQMSPSGQYEEIRRNNTWWSRFTAGTAELLNPIPGPTASIPIRDSAPAPYVDPFDESTTATSSSKRNTFGGLTESASNSTMATTASGKRSPHLMSVDEHGHHALDVSLGSVNSTATSIAMEERMRNMQVSQRMRTTSSHQTSSSSTDPFADATTAAPLLESDGGGTPGSIVFDGQAFGTPVEEDTEEETTPLVFQDEFDSPRKAAAHRRQPTVGETGIRAMIDEFERRSAFDETPPLPSEPVFLPQSPRKAAGRSIAIEHGLVRKPQLFVVN